MIDVQLVKDYLSYHLDEKAVGLVPREVRLGSTAGKATTIIGPRRAGKTSLMKEEMARLGSESSVYLDFEDIAIKGASAAECLRIVAELFTEVSGRRAESVFLDEIQNLGDWQSFVRTLLDRGYKVYVTGSSSRLLSREIATQLRGRSRQFLLLPFSFSEYLLATGNSGIHIGTLSGVGKLKNLLSSYLESGGYPEVVLGRDSRDRLLGEYRELIFLKDFVEREKAKSIDVARFVFNFVVQGFAGEITVRRIMNAMKSSGVPFGRNTVYDYVERLQDTMVFFFLGRYSPKVSMRAGWPKKVYLADNGLAWRLSSDKGRLMENVVFLQLKRSQVSNPLDDLYYYRDGRGEVDFVLKRGAVVIELLQVTYSEREVADREIKPLLEAGRKLRCRDLKVITWGYETVKSFGTQKVAFVPLWRWLLVRKDAPMR